MEPKRELKSVDVQFISLVGKGANKKTVIYKSAKTSPPSPLLRGEGRDASYEKVIPILKTNDEKRLVYGIVYAPNEVDTQGDFMTAPNIEKMAHAFLENKRVEQVDKSHNDQPGEGVVVESYIVTKGNEMFPDAEGSWAVAIKVVNDETWDAVKKGDITGLSMAGPALVEVIEKESIAKTIFEKVKKKFGSTASTSPASTGSADVAKDFNDQLLRGKFFPMMDAMYSAFWQIIEDDTIVDKQGAIADSLQQFKDQFTAAKSADAAAQTNQGDIDMKVEEVQTLVNTAVTEATKPLNDAIAKLTKSVEDLSKMELDKLGERIEKIEKSSAGRASVPGSDSAADADVMKQVQADVEKFVG